MGDVVNVSSLPAWPTGWGVTINCGAGREMAPDEQVVVLSEGTEVRSCPVIFI